MAHSALHFSLGMVIGSAATLPRVAKAWIANRTLAGDLRRWLLVSYALGLYAIVPSLLGWCGLPAAFCRGWWMNVFLLHPLLTRLKAGGMIPAGCAICFCFVVPYCLLLAALRRAAHREVSSN